VSRLIGRTRQEREENEAISLLLNRVVLGLLNDARHAGGFGADEAALESRAKELTERLVDRATIPGDLSVRLELLRGGRIELTVGEDEGVRASAEVREDGYVLGGSTARGGGGEAITIDPEDLQPWEREELRRRDLADEARRGRPPFEARDYRRTLVAPPQPDAAIRVLATALYGDGLIVEFTYDSGEPTEAELESLYGRPRPPMRIEDDLGTSYYEGERASYGGSPASIAYFTFAPGIPTDAAALRVTTDSGTVELDLT
jgi:hypothetical protein